MQDWVVDCEPVGSGQAAVKYLAPYVFRVALSNNRILKLENGQVTFRYQDGKTKKQKMATLPAPEFIRRFLQHVRPHRFQKVRCFGFFRSQQRRRLQRVKASLRAAAVVENSLLPLAQTQNPPSPSDPKPNGLLCPRCGRPLQLIELLPPHKLSPRATPAMQPP